MKKFIFILILFSFQIFSQEIIKITLEDAVRIAKENNKEIKNTRLNNMAIEGRYLEERSRAFPNISLSGYAAKEGDETFYKFSQGLFPKEQEVLSYDIYLSQTLYSWGKIGASIKAAKFALASIEESLKLTEEEVIKLTTEAFYDVLLQREILRISKENLDQKFRHLEEAEKKYELGTGTEYDILAAKVSYKNAKASNLKAENGLNILKERLKFIIGIEKDFEVEGNLEVKIEKLPKFEEAFQIALKERKELKIQQLYEKGRYEFIKIQSSENKPSVEFSLFFSRKNLSAGDYEINASSWNYMIGLKIPIFDGFRTKGAVIQAKSEYEKSKLQREKLIDEIRLEIQSSLFDAEEAEKILKVSEETVNLAKKWLKMAEDGFKFGVKTRLDVEDAQLNFSNAEANYAKAKRDYLLSWIKLKRAMGILNLN